MTRNSCTSTRRAQAAFQLNLIPAPVELCWFVRGAGPAALLAAAARISRLQITWVQAAVHHLKWLLLWAGLQPVPAEHSSAMRKVYVWEQARIASPMSSLCTAPA